MCDFHREQAWKRWLSTTANGMRSVKGLVLPRLRRIANAHTIDEYNQAVHDLMECDEWKAESSEKFRNYIMKTWLPVHKVSKV